MECSLLLSKLHINCMLGVENTTCVSITGFVIICLHRHAHTSIQTRQFSDNSFRIDVTGDGHVSPECVSFRNCLLFILVQHFLFVIPYVLAKMSFLSLSGRSYPLFSINLNPLGKMDV